MLRKNYLKILTGLFLIFLFSFTSAHAQNLDSLVNHSLQFAQQQLSNTVTEVGDTTRFPKSTGQDGCWQTKDSGTWTSGFFPGCLWYIYKWNNEQQWKNWATSWTASMEREKNDAGTHDVGFKIFCSFGKGYPLTQSETYRQVIIKAAQSLATRYNATVGCLRSWNNRTFPVIIDNMMNLEILFWASKNGGQPEWYDMAVTHALRTMEDHVRDDGSTYQIVDYNPSTGEIIRKETHQGYATESTWSRGQSWGVYGFAMTYRETGDNRFLVTAKKLADYVVENLPEDHVPYWDYNAPNIPSEDKDVSAAAIAASGLLELSTLVDSLELTIKYRNAAFNILTTLGSNDYLAESSNSSGILLHGVGNHNSNSEVDVSLIYADYYFIEALLRYQNITTAMSLAENQKVTLPNSIQLLQSYPNPFNPETHISYKLLLPEVVTLRIYDVTGRLVQTIRQGFQERGEHLVLFEGDKITSGIYLVVLQAGKERQSIKITLMR